MRDFTEIERRMTSLVVSLKNTLPEKAVSEVLQFIKHGEYGLALEELKYVYDETAQCPSAEVLTEMFDLAKIMEIKLE